ncbi:hypothetical protein ABIF73_005535 [Bradyrhizobium japonicum]
MSLTTLADLEVGAVLFRHGEVRPQLRQIGQRDDRRAGCQILSNLDLAHAEIAGERCAHQLLRDHRLGLGDAGHRLIVGSLRVIDGRLRAELARGQLLGAVERELRDGRLRLVIGEVALLRHVEELHQRRAGFDMGARLELDLGDAAVDVGADVDLMHGDEPADGGEQVRHDFRLRLGRADRGRRRLVVGEELLDHLAAEVIEPDKAANEHAQERADDDEPQHWPNRTLGSLGVDRFARNPVFGYDVHVMRFLQSPSCPHPRPDRGPNAKQLRRR